MVPTPELAFQQMAEGLVAMVLAKDRPNQDNLTVAILACEPDSVPAIKLAPGMAPPRKYLGWLVGGVVAGLAMTVTAPWYFH